MRLGLSLRLTASRLVGSGEAPAPQAWYENARWDRFHAVMNGSGLVAVWDGTPYGATGAIPKREGTVDEFLSVVAPADRSRWTEDGTFVQDTAENELRIDRFNGYDQVGIEGLRRFQRMPPAPFAAPVTARLLEFNYLVSIIGSGYVDFQGDTIDGGYWRHDGTGPYALSFAILPHSVAGDVTIMTHGDVKFFNLDTRGMDGTPIYPTIYIHNTIFPDTAHQARETIRTQSAVMTAMVNARGNKQGTVYIEGRFIGGGVSPGKEFRSAVGWENLGHLGLDVNGDAISYGGTGQTLIAQAGEQRDDFSLCMSYRERDDAGSPPFQDGFDGVRRLAFNGGEPVEHVHKYNGGIGDHSAFQLALMPQGGPDDSGSMWVTHFAVSPDLMTLEQVQAVSAGDPAGGGDGGGGEEPGPVDPVDPPDPGEEPTMAEFPNNSAQSGPGPVELGGHGMNLVSTEYGVEQHSFMNLGENTSVWRHNIPDMPWSWDYPLPPVDARGYPMEMPSTGTLNAFIIHTRFRDFMGDQIEFHYEGEGTYTFSGATFASRHAGYDVLNLTPGATEINIEVSALTPGNHLRNFFFCKPGEWQATMPKFRPEFLARFEGMKIIRFMDWMKTNNSRVTSWSQRTPEGYWAAAERVAGRPYEDMIDLCNETGCHLWICIPHRADADYPGQLAAFIRDRLDPALRVYVEYSNETWNNIFQVYDYLNDIGGPMWPNDHPYHGGRRYGGIRAAEVISQFRVGWGAGAADRVRGVLGAQAANYIVADGALRYGADYTQFDVIAIAPYFGNSFGDPTPITEGGDSYVDRALAGGLDYLFEQMEAEILGDRTLWVRRHRDMGIALGMEVMCYEAGQHLAGIFGAQDNQTLTDLFTAANRDPRMGELYTLYAEMIEANSGGTISWYTSMSRPSQYGMWGLLENEDDPYSPKWNAVLEQLGRDPVPAPAPPPPALQAVGTRGEIAYSQGNAVTANTRKVTGRTKHHFGPAPVSEFQVGYANFYVGDWTTGDVVPEIAAPFDANVRLYVEMNGVSVQALWDGQASGVIPAGGHVFCDPMLPEQFGLTEFPARGQFWLRVEKTAPLNSRHMYHTLTGDPAPPITGEATMFGQITATSKIEGTGTMTTAGGWTSFGGYQLPIAIIGRPKAPMAAYGIVGASIEHGANDSNRGDGENGGGYVRRALWTDKHPFIALQRGSEAARSFISNSAMRRPLLQYCNRIMCGHGGNDYSYGYSAENTQTRLATVWGLVKAAAMPGATVHQITLAPKTNSNDSWATLAGQTPRTGFESGGAWRDAVDAWVAGRVDADPNLDGVLNVRPAQDAASSPGRWRMDLGTPTTDGTHPSGPIHVAMANLLRTMLP